eukprot:GHVP01045519.1.p1 GENE.GHVP01045519.1~~GHVP01045519.1.p1  ORF type:complete len:144 (+),score=13.86 GHVP01045519.1:1028-1459(+)
MKCVVGLKGDHLRELRLIHNPTSGVKLTLMALCIMFHIPPNKVVAPNGSKFDDYVGAAHQNLLKNSGQLLDQIHNYDNDQIPRSTISKIQPLMKRKEFTPCQLRNSSVACEALCEWVIVMVKYNNAYVVVAPKGRFWKEQKRS